MEATKQYQVRLNGNLIFQSDIQPEAANAIICTIYNTLICAGCQYTKEWIKEQQGDYIRDVLEIKSKMVTYCIEHTDMHNGAKVIIARHLQGKEAAINALKHRFGCVGRAGYTITEKAFADTDVNAEQMTSYFCYRSRDGREQMLTIIKEN